MAYHIDSSFSHRDILKEKKYVIPLLLPYPYHLTVRSFCGVIIYYLFFYFLKKEFLFSPGLHLITRHLHNKGLWLRTELDSLSLGPRILMLTGFYESSFCVCVCVCVCLFKSNLFGINMVMFGW